VFPHPQHDIPTLCHNKTLSDVVLIGKGHGIYFNIIHAPRTTSDKVALWQLSLFLFLSIFTREPRGDNQEGSGAYFLREHLQEGTAGMPPSSASS